MQPNLLVGGEYQARFGDLADLAATQGPAVFGEVTRDFHPVSHRISHLI
jgi:hypothetical protein